MQQETYKHITEDMTVESVIQKYPFVMDTMAQIGISCVGCSAATWEPIGQGLRGHGFTDVQIHESMRKLNDAVEKHATKAPTTKTPVTITAKAVEKAKEFAKTEQKEGYHLRFKVVPGGCSGMTYDLHFDNSIADTDTVIEEDGIKVLVDQNSLQFAGGAEIDFVEGLQGSGFKINNPEAKSGCGCGKSFQ